jgi:hypothetical protein
VEEGTRVRYGSSASVPSRLDEAATGLATIVLVATDDLDDVARAIPSIVEHAPDGTQLVVVANAPDEAQAASLADLDAVDPGAPGVMTEVLWTSVRVGVAAAWNAGIRRAIAPVVVLVGPGTELRQDVVGPIVAALDDETVAVAGPVGLLTEDLRRFDEAGEDVTEVDAIGGAVLGFRRADYTARGPLDEHFVVADSLDVWWSLVLRDPWLADDEVGDDGPEGDADIVVDLANLPAPRRAVRVVADIVRHEPAHEAPGRTRLAKKNFYRLLKGYATRRDLLVHRGGDTPAPTTDDGHRRP